MTLRMIWQELVHYPQIQESIILIEKESQLAYSFSQHSEGPGVLQLVNEYIHENTGHTGGRFLWGVEEQILDKYSLT